jgi:hypothetical protein
MSLGYNFKSCGFIRASVGGDLIIGERPGFPAPILIPLEDKGEPGRDRALLGLAGITKKVYFRLLSFC